ncbi:unnamed protein product, partial [Chrysoparadoxa australica]
ERSKSPWSTCPDLCPEACQPSTMGGGASAMVQMGDLLAADSIFSQTLTSMSFPCMYSLREFRVKSDEDKQPKTSNQKSQRTFITEDQGA